MSDLSRHHQQRRSCARLNCVHKERLARNDKSCSQRKKACATWKAGSQLSRFKILTRLCRLLRLLLPSRIRMVLDFTFLILFFFDPLFSFIPCFHSLSMVLLCTRTRTLFFLLDVIMNLDFFSLSLSPQCLSTGSLPSRPQWRNI